MRTVTLATRYYRRFPLPNPLGYVDEIVTLDTAHSAFLVVDVYGPGSDVTREHVAPALTAARQLGIPIVYCGNSAPRVELDKYEFTRQRDRNAHHYFPEVVCELPVDPHEYHCGDGPWGRYIPEVAPQPGDYYVRKVVYSGFFETRLDTLLRHLGVTHLVAVGFSGSECLLGTLIDAYQRNYSVILLRDCTAASEETAAERATSSFTARMVLWMETYIGSSATSEDFMRACQATK